MSRKFKLLGYIVWSKVKYLYFGGIGHYVHFLPKQDYYTSICILFYLT
jgi:hypothetical protein